MTSSVDLEAEEAEGVSVGEEVAMEDTEVMIITRDMAVDTAAMTTARAMVVVMVDTTTAKAMAVAMTTAKAMVAVMTTAKDMETKEDMEVEAVGQVTVVKAPSQGPLSIRKILVLYNRQ